jgi:hypothetical protein
MGIADLLDSAQFVVDAQGNKKAVMFDLVLWNEFVQWLQQLEELEEAHEEAEDIKIVLEAEARIASGEETVRDWDEFEAELDELPA